MTAGGDASAGEMGEPGRSTGSAREGARVRLLVTIPCLDEAKTVALVIGAIPKEIRGIDAIEVLVIDDGSSDDTARIASDAGATVVRHETTRGLGATYREAVAFAISRGVDVMVSIDGDGQFDAADIPLLVEPIVRDGVDMATASRFLKPELVPEMPLMKRWGNHRVAGLVTVLTGERFHDVSCGFRALSSQALLRLSLFGGLTYTQETFIDLAFKGLAIREVPMSVRGTREFGESRVASNLWSYGWNSLHIMLRATVAYRPFVFLFGIALAFALPGLALLGFLAIHYLQSGAFSPHIWAGFVGGSLSFLAASTLVLGLVGDMLVRIRLNQEEVLYLLRRSEWERSGRRRASEIQ